MSRVKRSSRWLSSLQDLSEDTIECTSLLDRLQGRRRFRRRALHRHKKILQQVQRPPQIAGGLAFPQASPDPLLRSMMATLLFLLILAVSIFLVRQSLDWQRSRWGIPEGLRALERYQALR